MIHKHYNIVMLQQLLEVIYYLQKVEVISSLVTTKMLKQGVSSTLGYYRKVGTVGLCLSCAQVFRQLIC